MDVVSWWRGLPWRKLQGPSWVVLTAVSAWAAWSASDTATEAHDAAVEAKAATRALAVQQEALEAARVELCVEGRGDIRAAIVRVVAEFSDLTADEQARVGEVVGDQLPPAACATPPEP